MYPRWSVVLELTIYQSCSTAKSLLLTHRVVPENINFPHGWFVGLNPPSSLWKFKFSFIHFFGRLALRPLTPSEFPLTLHGVGVDIFWTTQWHFKHCAKLAPDPNIYTNMLVDEKYKFLCGMNILVFGSLTFSVILLHFTGTAYIICKGTCRREIYCGLYISCSSLQVNF